MPNYQLVMQAGPTPGKTFDLSGTEITLGRDINANLTINIPEVSRRHARFRQEGGSYLLEDLGSTNGTFVNGQRLSSPHFLRVGDVIMLGEAVTLFYQGPAYDPDATVASPSGGLATVMAPEPPRSAPPQPQPQLQNPPQGYVATMVAHEPITAPPPYSQGQVPSFSGQIPAGPVGSGSPLDFGAEMPPEEPKSRTWLWAGLGCLVVVLCGCVAGAILFDMMDMYCQPPFDSLLSFLYTCP